MNTSITFPVGPALKLNRPAPTPEQWASALSAERARLEEDAAALREREENLRQYETRLRALQARLDAGATTGAAAPFRRPGSTVPFEANAELQAAWEKLHRARELLAAEQSHLCDDRLKTRDRDASLKRREADLALREARLTAREKMIAAAETMAASAVAIKNEERAGSAFLRFTQAPFAMAKAVFASEK